MPFAIELALDADAGACVRRLWDELAEAGVTSMARSGAHPHVSLGIWDALDLPRVEAELAVFAREVEPLRVTFTSVRTLPPGVVFLAPEPTAELRALHATVQRRFAAFGTGAWAHYAPSAWVPHCTLATDVTDALATAALAIARRAPLPLDGRLERVGIVEFRPVKQVCAFDLGAGHG